ncbi:MAG: hypothetical protein UU72_C0049G0002 [candidate division WWE3 bacterium GW2011_GWB1_41_6]|uniref:LamG-like jellyroll fold domain-containing protein n=1 Tax=candidate division WWE3 bacterium GW2011_GWB1_41_6 TaxID=1619112 RepID=A0A0G0ZMW7_UNCKA|nr:MAG: hypothetical protein UU72_C0049G0002 [candidate division WWE3 bacterium GW2011_GWB1_41_6]
MWAYPEASSLETSEMRTLFAQQDGAGTGQSWLQIDDSPVQWRSYLGGSEKSSGITASINTWQHVVLVYDDSANTLTWYVDGREGATHTSVGVESATGNFILGAAKATTAGRYDGRLDEVNIFNTALTSDQVVLLFNQSKSVSMGSTSTASDGTTADNSTAREYCIPGDTTSCAGPVAEYKLDENTGTSGAVIYDTSGNNNTGTMTSFSASPSPWKPGKHGSSLQFNGSQYVAIADSDSLDYGTGDFTITVWVKTTETCTDNKVYWGQRYSPTTIWTGCDATGNVAGFDADSSVSSFSAIRGTTAINDGKWHQITAVKTGHASAYVYLYVDGVLEASAGPRSYSGDFNFGAGAGINSIGRLNVNPYYYPVAQIDHVRVYNYARTAAQVAWEHNHGGPVGWWQFDECTGVNAYDSSGHDNHGTVTEPGAGTNVGVGICTGSAGTMRSDGSNGKRNAALDFDGADDYVVVTDATAIQNIFDRGGAVTVWIYPRSDGEGNLGRILDKTDSVTEGWVINVREESAGAVKLWLGQEYTGNDRDWVTTNAVIPLNQWSHIAVVYDNSSTSNDPVFYLNGKTVSLSEQGSGNLPAKSDAGNNLYIGNRSNGQRTFDGMLDEVKMFNYSLTAHQVLVDYNEGAVRFE